MSKKPSTRLQASRTVFWEEAFIGRCAVASQRPAISIAVISTFPVLESRQNHLSHVMSILLTQCGILPNRFRTEDITGTGLIAQGLGRSSEDDHRRGDIPQWRCEIDNSPSQSPYLRFTMARREDGSANAHARRNQTEPSEKHTRRLMSTVTNFFPRAAGAVPTRSR
jgi:hypothetical protein